MSAGYLKSFFICEIYQTSFQHQALPILWSYLACVLLLFLFTFYLFIYFSPWSCCFACVSALLCLRLFIPLRFLKCRSWNLILFSEFILGVYCACGVEMQWCHCTVNLSHRKTLFSPCYSHNSYCSCNVYTLKCWQACPRSHNVTVLVIASIVIDCWPSKQPESHSTVSVTDIQLKFLPHKLTPQLLSLLTFQLIFQQLSALTLQQTLLSVLTLELTTGLTTSISCSSTESSTAFSVYT